MKMTHEVVRVRGGRVIRQFRSAEAAEAWRKRLRSRFPANRYTVREVDSEY